MLLAAALLVATTPSCLAQSWDFRGVSNPEEARRQASSDSNFDLFQPLPAGLLAASSPQRLAVRAASHGGDPCP